MKPSSPSAARCSKETDEQVARSWSLRVASRVEAVEVKEPRRINKDLLGFRKASLAAELKPCRLGFGKIASAAMVPDLVPLGWRQHVPQPAERALDAVEVSGAVLAGLPGRLVQQK